MSVDLGNNSGQIFAIKIGRILFIDGYINALTGDENYVLSTIKNVTIEHNTQITFQVGNPTEPYCMFGTLYTDGRITVGTSVKNTIYRINCAVVIK